MDDQRKKLFSRSNLLIWMPLVLGVLSVQIIFGLSDGVAGIVWRIIPIVFGLLYCISFFWLGGYLSTRMSRRAQFLILAAASAVSVFIGFATLVVITSSDPAEEFKFFLPGQTVFFLILFFSVLLTILGFCWRKPKQEK